MVPVVLTPLAAADGGADDGDDTDGSGAGLGLDFFVSLGASIGTLADSIAADRAERTRRQSPPGNEPLFNVGMVPASGTLILDLGAVPQGRVWQIRRVVLGGAKVSTTAAGTAYLFAQGAPPSDLNLTNCVDIFLSLPRGSTYGTHQLYLSRGIHLWAAFVGATAGQQYGASGYVESWDEELYATTFAE